MPYGMREGQLGSGHWVYIIFPRDSWWGKNKESEEHAPRFIPYPLTINRGLIESNPSTGFEPMTYETWSHPLPNLLQKFLSCWVESNWPELASGQDPKEKGYFSLEVERSPLVALISVFARNGLGEQGAMNWVEIEPGSLGYHLCSYSRH